MKDRLQKIKKNIVNELKRTQTINQLEIVYNKYFSRKSGEFSRLIKDVKTIAMEQKPVIGKLLNDVKNEAQILYDKIKDDILQNSKFAIQNSDYDPTLPGENQKIGTLHPITRVKNDLNDAFKFLGFEIYEGPEITSEAYAFDKLNFPEDHPAREIMDTYWIAGAEKNVGKNKLCLRPHLTGGSVRYMQTHKPPFRFVYPGRAFRNEATDAGHERCFYQYEALIVNDRISLAGGKILVDTILERVFGKKVKIRMRPGFFPFVEPGFEIDMQCLNCGGNGCSVCGDGWVEMMPGGPPHPNVFKAGNIDPKKWQGFYINIGLDRLVMMKYGIDDIRLMHSGDLRFLRQF
ncbi:phenylalanine--tRNA ligase subunit alpha [Candidatus Kuenenbacteria bacterium CG11_big_fil_rev_8_21_14_0_20_37_9]|uniref:phenylalanine--tRNA ligase n=2 Tax=Candidatus Kueneniibacteriota TaxID=1752740 RepID=A0A2M6XSZ2_9BACT|nr:MAG: phenylalanine--tRNA ligase subunit alpha [Candidatus Kuenenbacteria bacterium CG1_02_38_13]PIR05923.1 MAG: phenylalanine--tRNA ligase subunit alpha [Candidatus Kuenenbacteria bacterium CG11_big_fil_rev_8_21_14_0_20_37_9]PIU10760.1 MAG: phenylalanine--tRNA ligase subunit alpha [Candidatus Kuenenbacteria bacterium CG08_land_8_20_14_0_20_37_23]